MEEAPKTNRFAHWIKTSITTKMFITGFLCLVLLIPMALVKELIRERSTTQESVIKTINQQWGSDVTLNGPILQIPYKTYSEKIITDSDTKRTQTETIEHLNYAYFLPNSLHIKSNVNPEEKKKGIYKTAVFNSTINIDGSFDSISFASLEVADKDILWEKSKVILQTSNVKGVRKTINLDYNNHQYQFISTYNGLDNKGYANGNQMYILESGYLQDTDIPKEKSTTFSIQYVVNGSEQIQFIPVGKETKVEMTSNWKTANFIGSFLPYNGDKIKDDGFHAKWKVLDINRPFPQIFNRQLPNLQEYALGVNFMIPVDQYLKSTRSAKYGILVIFLTFLVFFLIQIMSNIHIHPFQYIMIGLALIMFYTLLISISEHSSFLKAYIIAAAAVVSLITWYSKTILNSSKFSLFIGASLLALYVFIFVIIQMESYALLTGSIGLFGILATVMFVSRKINWNS